ncbi:MAG: D-alanyl-D-alanine carboxypeptidase, partial [Defluviitaleaceae bacterium]|nr:D-alanyl-D-alanine carboxypeptidase [Defluviitaleaceae bacterium]
KTGSTSQALYCLSATANRNDMDLIAVVLAAPSPTARFQEAMKMLDYGFANYKVVKGELPGTVMGNVVVRKGEETEVCAMVETLVSNVTEKGNNSELVSEVTIYEVVDAPVAVGDIVGEIIYIYEGAEIGRSNLVAEEAVERAGFVKMLGRVYEKWFE